MIQVRAAPRAPPRRLIQTALLLLHVQILVMQNLRLHCQISLQRCFPRPPPSLSCALVLEGRVGLVGVLFRPLSGLGGVGEEDRLGGVMVGVCWPKPQKTGRRRLWRRSLPWRLPSRRLRWILSRRRVHSFWKHACSCARGLGGGGGSGRGGAWRWRRARSGLPVVKRNLKFEIFKDGRTDGRTSP